MYRIVLLLLICTTSPAYCQQIAVYFSPNGGAENAVIESINTAKKQIRGQAYSFTNKPIADALVAAKNRGIDVSLLLDKTNPNANGSKMNQMVAAGIPVKIDSRVSIAHNKLLMIDSFITVTGSFNFTDAAEHKNAENLLIIKDSALCLSFLKNWYFRESKSRLP